MNKHEQCKLALAGADALIEFKYGVNPGTSDFNLIAPYVDEWYAVQSKIYTILRKDPEDV